LTDTQSKIRIQIVCDAGPSVGLGHLSRMIFLGNKLNKKQLFDCSLAVLSSTDVVRHQLNQIHHQFYRGSLSEAVENVMQQDRFDVLIFDLSLERLNEVNPSLFENVRKQNIHQIGIDNLLRFSEFTDFTLVPAFRINSQFNQYINPKVKWGWNSYLLPLPEQVYPTHNNKLLVLTGSSDIAGLGQVLPTLMNTILADEIEINWVQGPMAKAPVVPDNPKHQWKIHVSPNGLESLMRECGYGISVYGVSLFELLSFQVPSVTLSPYCGKDDEDMQALEDAGIALYGSSAEHAVQRLNQLISAPELFKSLQHSCAGLMKHTGVEMIAEFVLKNSLIQNRT